MIMIKNNT